MAWRRHAFIWTNAVMLLRNKLQWNFKRNAYIFICENAFENVGCQIDGHFVQGGGGDELILKLP